MFFTWVALVGILKDWFYCGFRLFWVGFIVIKVFTCCSHAWVCLGAVYCSVLLWGFVVTDWWGVSCVIALGCARFLRGFELWVMV